MLVTIPKTGHHEGKESRFVPIGDILPWLEKEFHDAPDGSQRLITRFTESNVNLAKPFEKIITAAGFTVWPKLIQNLRASCETDWLDAGIPAHVVAKWIGHSVKVQNDNYAQIDDHHFDQFNAKAKLVQSAEKSKKLATTADDSSKVAIQVASERREMAKTDKPSKEQNPVKTNVLRGSADNFATVRCDRLPEAGVELSLFLQRKRRLREVVGLRVGQLKMIGVRWGKSGRAFKTCLSRLGGTSDGWRMRKIPRRTGRPSNRSGRIWRYC